MNWDKLENIEEIVGSRIIEVKFPYNSIIRVVVEKNGRKYWIGALEIFNCKVGRK